MLNPSIATFTVTVTAADTVFTNALTGLDGMLAAMLDFRFVMGTGGETCKAYAQYSIDGGITFRDAACAAFATSGGAKAFNITRMTEKLSSPVAAGDGELADNTAIGGMLGPIWRLKVISTGIYAGGTQVVLRVVPA